jgi:hypothetical protein
VPHGADRAVPGVAANAHDVLPVHRHAWPQLTGDGADHRRAGRQAVRPRHRGTLFGLTLLSHRIGGFFGAWLGGVALQYGGDCSRML